MFRPSVERGPAPLLKMLQEIFCFFTRLFRISDTDRHARNSTISVQTRKTAAFFSAGATLIDTLVSTALMLVVFVGISGAFQLSIDVITNNKARAGAIALSNERMEYIRSLPYDQVAVVGGIPAGSIPATESVALNGIPYTRRTLVLYADDPKDGLGAADQNGIIADYKEVKTEVSWESRYGTRRISLTSRVSPVGIESATSGGVLSLSIVHAGGQPVSGALVTIVNTTLNPGVNISVYSDALGVVQVIGAPAGAGYQITASRSGYTTAKTYDATTQNTNPTPGHLTVANGQTTTAQFAIDLVATKNIRTYQPVQPGTWTDAFSDMSKLAASNDIEVSGGTLKLAGGLGSHASSGAANSIAIAPSDLARWITVSWDDTRPAQTNILYRVYSGDGTSLIPDAMIPGNSTGFSAPPVSLTGVSTSTYPSLSVQTTLGTADPAVTPEITSWDVSYEQGPLPLPNVTFGLKGTKTIGSGPGGFIYLYSTTTLSSGPSAGVNVANLEWDSYTISVDGVLTNYDISSSCEPQPEALSPGAYLESKITLSPHTTHSLLVDVKSGGAIIQNASVRLYRGGYDTTKSTDTCGNAFFSALSQGTPGGGNPYSINVSASGYQAYSATDVTVSGTSRLSVVLNSL